MKKITKGSKIGVFRETIEIALDSFVLEQHLIIQKGEDVYFLEKLLFHSKSQE
jgi:hypothetical protein